jgi:hypothetical protein
MRRNKWTGFLAALALLTLVMPTGALASPGEARVGATLRFQLSTGGVVVQPFGRWLGELAGMTALTIDSATWKDGEAMALRLTTDGSEAWSVSLLSDEQGVSMESSLMAEGSATLSETDALEARALMAGFRAVAAGPAEQKLTAAQFAVLARGAAATLSRWGEAAKGTEGEASTALADFVTALAEVADEAGDAIWLTVTVEANEPATLLVEPGVSPAPPELPAILAMEGFRATLRAIAEG